MLQISAGHKEIEAQLAEAAITIGVLIILARSLFVREKAPEEPADAAPQLGNES